MCKADSANPKHLLKCRQFLGSPCCLSNSLANMKNFSFILQNCVGIFTAGICLQTLVLAGLYRPFTYYSNYAKHDKNTSSTDFSTTRNAEESTSNEHDMKLECQEQRNLGHQQHITSVFSSQNRHRYSSTESESEEINQLTSASKNAHETSAVGRLQSFNWKLVYNPRCVSFGICAVLFVGAIHTSYQSIPPLGQQTGM